MVIPAVSRADRAADIGIASPQLAPEGRDQRADRAHGDRRVDEPAVLLPRDPCDQRESQRQHRRREQHGEDRGTPPDATGGARDPEERRGRRERERQGQVLQPQARPAGDQPPRDAEQDRDPEHHDEQRGRAGCSARRPRARGGPPRSGSSDARSTGFIASSGDDRLVRDRPQLVGPVTRFSGAGRSTWATSTGIPR